MEISKRDWKLFREKLPAWQENYMDRLINEYIGLLSDILNVGKSEAIYDMVRLIRLEVITFDDLADFSEDLQQAVKLILGIERK